jgi:hypothetical protein
LPSMVRLWAYPGGFSGILTIIGYDENYDLISRSRRVGKFFRRHIVNIPRI